MDNPEITTAAQSLDKKLANVIKNAELVAEKAGVHRG